MCIDCGCSEVNSNHVHIHTHHEGEHHHHAHAQHEHEHHHHTHTIDVHTSLLSKNDRLAERNRGFFAAKGLLVLNILSSPGAGKTALIERMGKDLNHGSDRPLRLGVIVGDLATDNDAARIRNAGVPAIQITTGNACHLEADMVAKAMTKLDLNALDLLLIENVGNLVCPAVYDLGENARIVLMSVTEGEDKPLKYPTMFKSAQVVLLTKMDLAAAVDFDREQAVANIQRLAPQAQIIPVSSRSGAGMDEFYEYLHREFTSRQEGFLAPQR